MIKTEPKHIAWFIPASYFIHITDEYFSRFPQWFSGIFKVDLSLNDFIIINAAGLSATIVLSVLYSLNKINHFVIASLGMLLFINGVVHIAASVITFTYSPGTLSALLVYLPLGYLIFKKIFPLIPEFQRGLSIVAGIFIQIIVALLAMNI